jgi:hypothetical protein
MELGSLFALALYQLGGLFVFGLFDFAASFDVRYLLLG